MELLIKYLGVDKIYKHSSLTAVELKIVKFEEIKNKIIPMFQKFPIQGVKQLDY
jgi:hypothetical protein